MKDNTVWILLYMLLAAAFAYMVGWISGDQVSRRKSAEQQLAELTSYLPRIWSSTSDQQLELKQIRSVLNDAHKQIVAVSKGLKNPAR
jgi:septal ring factor EnvC (AmiA/AmiB activator)